MYQYNFEIADILFSIHIDHEIKMTEGFEPFICDGAKKEKIDIWIRKSEELPRYQGESCFKSIVFRVYEADGKYIRLYYDHLNEDKNYAVGRILDEANEEILYLKKGECFLSESHNTFSHVALEELLVTHQAMMLHAACIRCEFGGILFSGSSGIGKSTQAELWKCYKNAQIINGDKTILRKREQKWQAYGSPYAGSSRYFVNASCEIRAIVLLEKGEKCELRKLTSIEAFQRMYPHIIVNTWNINYIKRISMLLEDLLEHVQVYQFVCTPDKEAVDFLYGNFRGESK